MPCPNSTLPVNTVTVPLGLTRSHADNSRLPLRLPGRRAGVSVPWAGAHSGAHAIPTTRPVPAFRRVRRETFRSDAVTTAFPWTRAIPHARCGYVRRIGTGVPRALVSPLTRSALDCARAA